MKRNDNHPTLARPLWLAAILALGSTSTSVAFAHGQSQPSEPEEASEQSQQPVSDTWITTKVKADLLATQDVSGLDISVETVNGVVKLSGTVDNQAQFDKAVAVSQGIDGVLSVDTAMLKVAGK